MDSTTHTANPCLDAALGYAKFGWSVFPADSATKRPHKAGKHSNGKRWGATKIEAEIKRDFNKWQDAAVCIPTGIENGIWILEADTPQGHDVDGIANLQALIDANGPLPETRMAQSPSGSVHYYFTYPDEGLVRNSASTIAPGVDVRGEGGMVVGPPSLKSDGEYKWLNEAGFAKAPQWLLDLVIDKEGNRSPGVLQASPEKIAKALSLIPNNNLDWESWNRIGMAAWLASCGHELVFAAFDQLSQKSKKYDAKTTHERWYRKYPSSPPDHVGAGTLFRLALEEDPTWMLIWNEEHPEEAEAEAAALDVAIAEGTKKTNGAAPPDDADDPKPDTPDSAPALSEDYLALQFTKTHAGTLRYVAPWGKWLIWDGGKWCFDEKLKAFTLARQICRIAAKASTSNTKKEAKAIASAKTRSAVISLASADPCHAASIDQWDTDPWLLNTPGGVIDLRSGKIRDHRATDYMTKMTAVTPDRAMPIPLWLGFLNTILADDSDLQGFIRRVSGYSLTGVTIEHALFFLHGMGSNGKGVLINTLSGILSDYQKTATLDAFTASTNERHPTDLAMLRGARLVTVSETESGKRWSESRIKTLTGGDPITARFMRQDFFTYMPQFKLMISGQHRPGLSAVNNAIRRRVNMLPFNVTISDDQVDKNLTEKLKAEWPGILAWMIEGCLEWQRVGLQQPKSVIDATADYLDTEDKLGRWIRDCCVRDPNAWTSSTDLFYSWKNWAEENNEWFGSQTRFSGDLKEAGFKKHDTKTSNGFDGLALKPLDPHEAEAARSKR